MKHSPVPGVPSPHRSKHQSQEKGQVKKNVFCFHYFIVLVHFSSNYRESLPFYFTTLFLPFSIYTPLLGLPVKGRP